MITMISFGTDRLCFLYNVSTSSLILLSLGFCHVPIGDNNTNKVKREYLFTVAGSKRAYPGFGNICKMLRVLSGAN